MAIAQRARKAALRALRRGSSPTPGLRETIGIIERYVVQETLGPLRSLTYLDQLLPRHPFDPRERPLEVYRVDDAQGSELCGISPDAAGRVGDFLCRRL